MVKERKCTKCSKDVSGAQEKILRQTDQFIEVFLILLCFLNCLIKQNQCLSKINFTLSKTILIRVGLNEL